MLALYVGSLRVSGPEVLSRGVCAIWVSSTCTIQNVNQDSEDEEESAQK